MQKNDRINLKIDSVSLTGAGIGRFQGMAVFVDNTAAGDEIIAHIIKVNKKFAVGKLVEVLVPSVSRVESDCPVSSSCGGCSFRHIAYSEELRLKENAVRDAIMRIGGIDKEPLEITPSPITLGYRNKAQYPIAKGDSGIAFGFYARHSHRVIKSENCRLQPAIFDKALAVFKAWADEYCPSVYDEATGKGLLRHILLRYGEATGELMVVPVINGESLPAPDKLKSAFLREFEGEKLSLQYNINREDTNVILGKKTVPIYGKEYITDILCGVKLAISPKSFYQVNRLAAELLYKKAADYIRDDDKVILDLFCGIGSIGLSVISLKGDKERSLYGVEIVPEAIENAKFNARENGVLSAEFICGDAAKAAADLKERGIKPDVVIVDPPRKGCDAELIKTIALGFAPKKLIYISCDPATLARDSKILRENGYNLEEYSPVDLFPSTAHTETVALFSRQKVTEHIYIDVDIADLPKTTRTTATYQR